jgi:threonine dehydratase
MSQPRTPDLRGVLQARNVISRYLKPTPLFFSAELSSLLGCEAYVKLENLQPIGAFKIRGGINYMHNMHELASKNGVIVASTGNHSQSIAYAGRLYGVKVRVVMPEGIPELKVRGVQAQGGEVITKGRFLDESRDYAKKLAKENGYLMVGGANEPLLVEGVATMHLEVIEELPEVEVVINQVGGGSGLAGACVVYKTMSPGVRIFGAQAEGAPAFYRSWKGGTIVSTEGVNTKAEGLALATAYDATLRVVKDKLEDVVLVSDDEMMRAVRVLFETTRQVAELSGSASTAAAFKIKERIRGKKVVMMLTGGNIAPELLAQILQK